MSGAEFMCVETAADSVVKTQVPGSRRVLSGELMHLILMSIKH